MLTCVAFECLFAHHVVISADKSTLVNLVKAKRLQLRLKRKLYCLTGSSDSATV